MLLVTGRRGEFGLNYETRLRTKSVDDRESTSNWNDSRRGRTRATSDTAEGS